MATTWNGNHTPVEDDMWNLVTDMRKQAVLNNRVIPVYSKSERDGLASVAPDGVVPEGTVVLRVDQVNKGAIFDVFADGKWVVGDTGIMNSGVNITGIGGVIVDSYAVSRTGPLVTIGVDLTYKGVTLTADSVCNIADTRIFNIETAWSPLVTSWDVSIMRTGVTQWFGYLSDGGNCAVTHGSAPGIELKDGHPLRVDGTWRIA